MPLRGWVVQEASGAIGLERGILGRALQVFVNRDEVELVARVLGGRAVPVEVEFGEAESFSPGAKSRASGSKPRKRSSQGAGKNGAKVRGK